MQANLYDKGIILTLRAIQNDCSFFMQIREEDFLVQLVIAEKPSVAGSIAAALGVKEKKDGYIEGGGYLISWCVGHLVELADAAAYGEQYKKWSYESLPILPEEWQYTVAADKGKQFKTLKELMHRADVSEVVNACDAGREGELIFRFVYGVAQCNKPMRRLWISSMEDAAIKAGFADLKDGRDYDALYASALCRAKADWIIGINATRLFSCLYHKKAAGIAIRKQAGHYCNNRGFRGRRTYRY